MFKSKTINFISTIALLVSTYLAIAIHDSAYYKYSVMHIENQPIPFIASNSFLVVIVILAVLTIIQLLKTFSKDFETLF